MNDIRERAKQYAADAKTRNTQCDCYLCKELEAKELLQSVQQITERWPMPATILHLRSKR